MKVVGIDLAGKAMNPSGFAVLSEKILRVTSVHPDHEIISSCFRERPKLVAIDAPLSMPLKGNLRVSDLALIERGLRVLPPTLGGMRQLTERGMRISEKLRKKGLRVIEIHPRTSGVIIFGTGNRRKWTKELFKKGFKLKGVESEHEVDAALAAVTAWLHLLKKTETVGVKKEGAIVIPLPKALESV